MDSNSPEDLKLMSVAEARRIMGSPAKDMKDEDIEKAIYDLTAIARQYIRSVPK